MKSIIVLVTFTSTQEATRVARVLLEKRLVACANILPVKSLYRWKWKIEESAEALAVLKTTEDRVPQAREAISKLHSYEVPCITTISVEENASCQQWLEGELGGE